MANVTVIQGEASKILKKKNHNVKLRFIKISIILKNYLNSLIDSCLQQNSEKIIESLKLV